MWITKSCWVTMESSWCRIRGGGGDKLRCPLVSFYIWGFSLESDLVLCISKKKGSRTDNIHSANKRKKYWYAMPYFWYVQCCECRSCRRQHLKVLLVFILGITLTPPPRIPIWRKNQHTTINYKPQCWQPTSVPERMGPSGSISNVPTHKCHEWRKPTWGEGHHIPRFGRF